MKTQIETKSNRKIVEMKKYTVVSVIICFANETNVMTFITMICFKLCSVMRMSYI